MIGTSAELNRSVFSTKHSYALRLFLGLWILTIIVRHMFIIDTSNPLMYKKEPKIS